jgi:molybdopterin-guanine dinucleotide biosynthesis protein A
LWPVHLRDELRRALTVEGIRKVDVWTARYPLATVAFPDEISGVDPFFNANRPEDLDRAAALLAER